MISCLPLERPGRWRIIGLIALLSLCAAPVLPLLIQAAFEVATLGNILTDAFVRSLLNSFFIAIVVAVVSYAIGLPLGILPAVFQVRGHKVLMDLLALPLLLPSFLVAIGWSSLAAVAGEPIHSFINGRGGCVLVFGATGIPLGMLTAYTACTSLTASQLDAVRLSGGAAQVLRYVFWYASTPTLFAAVLAAILSVSGPGPGQIFGVLTAGSEILTSVAALYDFALAGQQCLTLGVLVLLIAAPLILFTAAGFTSSVLARQTRPAERLYHPGIEVFGTIGLVFVLVFFLMGPLFGLLLPLSNGVEIERAIEELGRTTLNTALFAVLAGGICTCLAFAVAFFVGRDRRVLSAVVVVLAIMFILPPSLGALGILQARTYLPVWLDPLINSRLTVAGALALRFVPLIGASGCGKSTLLRLLAGLESPDAGEILLDGGVISAANEIVVPPHQRGVSMVFQDLALWPNLSVLENVLLGLSGLRLARTEAKSRANEMLRICGIESHCDRLPGTLSGGEQQRVALARALAPRPRFVLLDEPFAGLDLNTKSQMLEEIASLILMSKSSLMVVTHDLFEASILCERAIVMTSGEPVAKGTLDEILWRSEAPLIKLFREQVSKLREQAVDRFKA